MDLDARAGRLLLDAWASPAFEVGVAAPVSRHAHLRFGVGYARTDLGWDRILAPDEDATIIGEPPLLVRDVELTGRMEWRTGPGVQRTPSWDAGPTLGLTLAYGQEQRAVVLAEEPPSVLLVEVTPYAPRLALRPAVGGYAAIWMGSRVALVVEGSVGVGLALLGEERDVRVEHASTVGLRVRLGPPIAAREPPPEEGGHYAPELLPPWRQ